MTEKNILTVKKRTTNGNADQSKNYLFAKKYSAQFLFEGTRKRGDHNSNQFSSFILFFLFIFPMSVSVLSSSSYPSSFSSPLPSPSSCSSLSSCCSPSSTSSYSSCSAPSPVSSSSSFNLNSSSYSSSNPLPSHPFGQIGLTAVCSICFCSQEGKEESDTAGLVMVMCRGCGAWVHCHCGKVGPEEESMNNWRCGGCRSNEFPLCSICPFPGSVAISKDLNGKWVHTAHLLNPNVVQYEMKKCCFLCNAINLNSKSYSSPSSSRSNSNSKIKEGNKKRRSSCQVKEEEDNESDDSDNSEISDEEEYTKDIQDDNPSDHDWKPNKKLRQEMMEDQTLPFTQKNKSKLHSHSKTKTVPTGFVLHSDKKDIKDIKDSNITKKNKIPLKPVNFSPRNTTTTSPKTDISAKPFTPIRVVTPNSKGNINQSLKLNTPNIHNNNNNKSNINLSSSVFNFQKESEKQQEHKNFLESSLQQLMQPPQQQLPFVWKHIQQRQQSEPVSNKERSSMELLIQSQQKQEENKQEQIVSPKEQFVVPLPVQKPQQQQQQQQNISLPLQSQNLSRCSTLVPNQSVLLQALKQNQSPKQIPLRLPLQSQLIKTNSLNRELSSSEGMFTLQEFKDLEKKSKNLERSLEESNKKLTEEQSNSLRLRQEMKNSTENNLNLTSEVEELKKHNIETKKKLSEQCIEISRIRELLEKELNRFTVLKNGITILLKE